MEFTIPKNILTKELGFVQGAVEKKNTIPALSNILVETVGGDGAQSLRFTGTDLDVTVRCEAGASEVRRGGSLCVGARKLFEIARVLPDAPVTFRRLDNDWVEVVCEKFRSKIAGVSRDQFPDVPQLKTGDTVALPAAAFVTLVVRTIFAITLEESRYTLSGAQFEVTTDGVRVVTTDGHRLAFIERKGFAEGTAAPKRGFEMLVPRKALSEMRKLAAAHEGNVEIGTDDNHIYFIVGPRTLISRRLTGQFPNYEMVIPKSSDRSSLVGDGQQLLQALRRTSLMADARSHAVRLKISPGTLALSAETAEEGEAREVVAVEYAGGEEEIGFNGQYLQDFLSANDSGAFRFEFKDGNSQAKFVPVEQGEFSYSYTLMPMRV